MRIFLTSDWHIGIYQLNLTKWIKRQEEFIYDFFIPLIKKEMKPGDILIHLGDLYDNRSYIDIKAMNFAEKVVSDISDIIPFHLIVGNHDMYNKSSGDINSVNLFKYMKNVKVYNSPTVLDLNGKKCVLMPWINSTKKQIEIINKFKPADYLFCHSDLNGCKMHMNSVSHMSKDRIDLKHFRAFNKVYAGHIHIVQDQDNFTFVGSPMQYDRGDYKDKKGVFILNVENGTHEFFENTVSPVFEKIEIIKDEDLELLENVNFDNYVDLKVSNNLLIKNNKLRRKLEKLMEDNNFSKVEYINDVEKSVKKEEESLEDFDFSDIKEIEKVVLKYIESKKWGSEKIRTGILKEYEEILKIYKN